MGTQLAAGTLRERVLSDASQLSAQSSRQQRVVLDRIAETLAREVGDTCCIALLEHGRLNPVALGHRDQAARRLLTSLVRLPLGMSAIPAATIVMVTQRPMRTEALPLPVMLSMFPRLSPYVRRYPIESMLSLPLRGEPKAVGALGFVRHEKNNPYTQEDQEFLLELADAIAAGLQRPAAE
ncbi:MAG TPA: GAF domain-containing protein [Thermoleophilaceae bacterium]